MRDESIKIIYLTLYISVFISGLVIGGVML